MGLVGDIVRFGRKQIHQATRKFEAVTGIVGKEVLTPIAKGMQNLTDPLIAYVDETLERVTPFRLRGNLQEKPLELQIPQPIIPPRIQVLFGGPRFPADGLASGQPGTDVTGGLLSMLASNTRAIQDVIDRVEYLEDFLTYGGLTEADKDTYSLSVQITPKVPLSLPDEFSSFLVTAQLADKKLVAEFPITLRKSDFTRAIEASQYRAPLKADGSSRLTDNLAKGSLTVTETCQIDLVPELLNDVTISVKKLDGQDGVWNALDLVTIRIVRHGKFVDEEVFSLDVEAGSTADFVQFVKPELQIVTTARLDLVNYRQEKQIVALLGGIDTNAKDASFWDQGGTCAAFVKTCREAKQSGHNVLSLLPKKDIDTDPFGYLLGFVANALHARESLRERLHVLSKQLRDSRLRGRVHDWRMRYRILLQSMSKKVNVQGLYVRETFAGAQTWFALDKLVLPPFSSYCITLPPQRVSLKGAQKADPVSMTQLDVSVGSDAGATDARLGIEVLKGFEAVSETISSAVLPRSSDPKDKAVLTWQVGESMLS
ncbi:MAG: hypothetical protein H6841_06245 [Planctomycetes bacterium]|nr:hypothetical protein [Planctomycetota bacterium]MCB9936076.1 hypothetical protein [Planctomycetota bacterium]